MKFAPFRTSWAEIGGNAGRSHCAASAVPQRENTFRKCGWATRFFFIIARRNWPSLDLWRFRRKPIRYPLSADPRWLTCDFAPIISINRPVSRAQIKTEPILEETALIRQPRLAVMPLTEKQFRVILKMGEVSI